MPGAATLHLLLLSALLGLMQAWADDDDAPVVRVSQGLVKGSVMTSQRGRRFLAFRGMPYARPPVGDLRFAAPEDALPWTGLLDATRDGPLCLQKDYLMLPYKVKGQEDCLFINVYTPRINASFLLDVMVFIHGGGFFSGTGASNVYGPQFLLDKDVVLVTFNYRVAALGFLSTGDAAAPGNYGLKDQVAALRWVKSNIQAFGGDPHSVTIFGQSAGAASVHYHILSPMSKGLFHRAISESGTALCKFALPADGLPLATKQAQLVGCPVGDDTAALVACLRRADAHDIVESGDHFHTWLVNPLNVFGPVVESNTSSGQERFLPESPYCIIKKRAFSYVPWVQGVVLDEGIIAVGPMLASQSALADLNANMSRLMPELLQLRASTSSPEVAEALWRNVSAFYLNGDLPVTQQNAQGLVDLFSDRAFKYGSHQASVLHAAAGHASVFNYHFTYQGNKSFTSVFAPGVAVNYGPSHCDDLIYLFNIFGLFSEDDPDYHVMDTFVTMWTNFAKYGNPTVGSPGLENLTAVYWQPVQVQSQATGQPHVRYLSIDAATGHDSHSQVLRLEMREDLEKKRSDFWEAAPIHENACGGCC